MNYDLIPVNSSSNVEKKLIIAKDYNLTCRVNLRFNAIAKFSTNLMLICSLQNYKHCFEEYQHIYLCSFPSVHR